MMNENKELNDITILIRRLFKILLIAMLIAPLIIILGVYAVWTGEPRPWVVDDPIGVEMFFWYKIAMTIMFFGFSVMYVKVLIFVTKIYKQYKKIRDEKVN